VEGDGVTPPSACTTAARVDDPQRAPARRAQHRRVTPQETTMRTAFLRALLCAFLGAFRRAFVCAFAFRHPCPLAAPTARRSRDPAAALSARAPRRVISAVAAAALLAFSAGALAEPARGKTEEGVAYAMGGVSVEELTALERHKDRYSLWLTLAARGTGAYLADVEVRITATDGASPGRLVFNALVPGPWLMIDLPPGRYAVQAARMGQPQTRNARITRGDRHQMFFYFDVPVERSPEWHSPFPGNPYDNK
jgi:hypothetical protein